MYVIRMEEEPGQYYARREYGLWTGNLAHARTYKTKQKAKQNLLPGTVVEEMFAISEEQYQFYIDRIKELEERNQQLEEEVEKGLLKRWFNVGG